MKFKWPSEWKDFDAMSYLISDFTSSTVRPSRKLAFWSNLICDVCLYRKSPFVTHSDLKRCLAWQGNPPRCLDGVLDDMQSKHTVVKCNKLTETWSQWGFGILVSPITSVWQKIIPDNSEQKFVVVSVLEECKFKVLDHIHASSATLLYTIKEWEDVLSQFIHHSNTDNFNKYLTFQRCITAHGDPISLIKVRGREEKFVQMITQIDVAIGAARSTRDMLVVRTKHLREQVNDFHIAAMQARNRNRTEALANLRRKKMYEKSLENQDGALNNTESLLLQLQEAQQQKIIISTLKVGADALNKNKVSLTEVDNIMDQLEEYKEYEEDLNSALKFDTSHMSDETALEEELAALLTEDTGSPPAKKMLVAPDVIDLTEEDNDILTNPTPANDTKELSAEEELDELTLIEEKLTSCPEPVSRTPNHREEFEDSEHPVVRESVPKEVTARLSPELRRKPGRKLVGTLVME